MLCASRAHLVDYEMALSGVHSFATQAERLGQQPTIADLQPLLS
jgi:hypothetical protein